MISFKCIYFVCQGAIYIITKSKMLKESMINMVIVSYTTYYQLYTDCSKYIKTS